ncbi:MAG: ABC transporter substrate-binding protein [Lachnospirales bacterium]
MKIKKLVTRISTIVMATMLFACGFTETQDNSKENNTEVTASNESSTSEDSSNKALDITLFGWDTFQREGMEALAARYTEIDPSINISVDISAWTEYWTKLEAMANSNTLPDIFWMHTNEFSRYAEGEILADVTDLYNDVEENYYKNNFVEGLVNNVTYNGKIYGIPKDVDTIGLLYNKDLLDEAGVAYPDETWTWEDLVNAAQKITDTTGKYGFAAPLDDQEGYHNLIYQAEGYMINDNFTDCGIDDTAGMAGLKEWYSWQNDYNFSPTQAQLSELGAYERFAAGEVAMRFGGSWGINNLYLNYPDLNWDVAVLPKATNPKIGDGRASIYNGLSYATYATHPELEKIKKVLKFLGSEEAAIIHGEKGAAIPAFNSTYDSWTNTYEGKNTKVYSDMMEYGVQFPYSKSKSEWGPLVEAELLSAYNGEKTIEEACKTAAQIVNEHLAAE